MANKNRLMHSKRRIYAGVGIVAIVGALLVSGASLSAQSGPSADCSATNASNFGTQFFGVEEFGNRLLSTSPTSRVFDLPSAMVAGTYTIDAVSYDGYPNRDTVAAQPLEQWFAEFLAADGTVLATTGSTGELEDLVLEATWSGSLGEVTLADTATQIRTIHVAPGDPLINSVRPVCVGAELVVTDPDPAPTTTIPDPAPTTTVPDPTPTTAPDPTPDTDGSSDPVEEVPTEVQGQVETPAETAIPQPGNPAFTG